MMFFRQALLFSTLLLTTLATPGPAEQSNSAVDWDLFHRLLESVDDQSIHAILHSLAPKFKHGVFSKDRSAIEQVHSENPPLATSLIHLAKRQSNSTVTSSISPASSSIASVESSLSSVATSLSSAASSLTSLQSSLKTTITSAQASQSSASASLTSAEGSLSSELAASSAFTASTKPAPTSLALAPTTPSGATPVATSKGAVVFSSSGGGLVTVASSTAFITYSRSRSEVLSTYTLPNGQLTTATSVVVVNAPITASIDSSPGTAGAASTTGSSAGLQSGASGPNQPRILEAALMLGGVAAIAMLL